MDDKGNLALIVVGHKTNNGEVGVACPAESGKDGEGGSPTRKCVHRAARTKTFAPLLHSVFNRRQVPLAKGGFRGLFIKHRCSIKYAYLSLADKR